MNCIRRRALAVGAFRRSFRVARQLFPGQVGERHLGRTVLAAVGSVSSTPSVPREFSERAASSRISAIWYYSRCRGNSRAHASLLNPGWKKSTGRWSAPPPTQTIIRLLWCMARIRGAFRLPIIRSERSCREIIYSD